MLGLGLIEESDKRPDPELDPSRRSYYRLTGLGRRLLAGEVERVTGLVERNGPQQGQGNPWPALELDPTYAGSPRDEIAVTADNMNYAGPCAELAELWMYVGKYDEAESRLRRALVIYPDVPNALLNLGITLNYLRRYADAVEPLSKLLRLRPHWLSPHVYLGIALLETGQPAEAQMHLECATCSGGRVQALAYLYSGKLYAQRGEVEKTAAAWKTYLEKDPDSPNARRVRELLSELGRPPEP
jgi:tetratricopeptide (TPR) repeat protein